MIGPIPVYVSYTQLGKSVTAYGEVEKLFLERSFYQGGHPGNYRYAYAVFRLAYYILS